MEVTADDSQKHENGARSVENKKVPNALFEFASFKQLRVHFLSTDF
jgi:hypothetical protein